jgi:hypothetical protein
MAVGIAPLAKQQFNQNGVPLAGGKLFTYAAGTTNKQTSYTNSYGNVPNTNPIILDSNGQCDLWLTQNLGYKLVLSPPWDTDPPQAPYWTEDNIESFAPVAVGNMTDELGYDGNPGFKANHDFTPGSTTSLTLSQGYGLRSNLWVAFDAAEQGADQYTLNGETLSFNSAIPVGVNTVYVKGGTTLTVGTPSIGSVTDASIAQGSALYQRLIQWVSVMDPAYGAKGDGVTDDTTAIQACINANAYVRFPAGKTFKTSQPIVVPTTCHQIDGAGANMVGPGLSSTVNAFHFIDWYQGGGSIPVQGEFFWLPSLNGYQYGIYIYNSGFIKIYCDTIQYCQMGWFVNCDNASNYCFELDLESRFIWHCRNTTNTGGGAFYFNAAGNSSNCFQGNRIRAFYIDDCWSAVSQVFTTTGTAGNINNVYDLGEVDQSGYVIYCNGVHSSSQLYKVPMGITSPQASINNGQCFLNISVQDCVVVGGMTFNNPGFTAANNFQFNGGGVRPFIYQESGGVPTIYVDSAHGSDQTGTGRDIAPFATIQQALNQYQGLDINGSTVYIALRDGTYSAGATMGFAINGTVAIVGDVSTPSNVVINGSFTANGVGASLSVSAMVINGQVLAENDATIAINSGITFGPFGGAQVQALNGGLININSSYAVTGAAAEHLEATVGGTIANNGSNTLTISGTLPYTVFANASNLGQILTVGLSISGGGGVSGVRYQSTLNSVIWTNGAGANYFPGTSAGTTSTGGQYA